MNDTSTTLLGAFGISDGLIPLVLEDISEEDGQRLSRGDQGPSIAWTVGHLLNYRYSVMNALGDDRPSPYGDQFSHESPADGTGPGVAELLAAWNALSPDFVAVSGSTSEETWNQPGAGPHSEQTLRDQVTFFAWHEGYHMGALGALRKAMGYPGPAEKVLAAREAAGAGD